MSQTEQQLKNNDKNDKKEKVEVIKVSEAVTNQLKTQIEETLIQMLMRQTIYTREEAIESFERNKTIDKCIEEYLGCQKKNDMPTTTNQAIFKTMRDFFDNQK
jgi:hypothetical protein